MRNQEEGFCEWGALVIFFDFCSVIDKFFEARFYYLATQMTGHDIKIISSSGARRAWSKKVILLSDYQTHISKETTEQKRSLRKSRQMLQVLGFEFSHPLIHQKEPVFTNVVSKLVSKLIK